MSKYFHSIIVLSIGDNILHYDNQMVHFDNSVYFISLSPLLYCHSDASACLSLTDLIDKLYSSDTSNLSRIHIKIIGIFKASRS